MNITDVKVWPNKNNHKTIKANAQFVVDGGIKIKCTIFEGQKGPFIGLPGRYGDKPGEDGKKPWYSDVDCISKEAREELNAAVINKYNEVTGSQPSNQGEASGPTSQDDRQIPFG